MFLWGLVGASFGLYAGLLWVGTDVQDRKLRISTVLMIFATLGMVLVMLDGASVPFIAYFGFLCIFAGIRMLVTPDISGLDVLSAVFFIPVGIGFTLGWLWNDAYAVHREYFTLLIIMIFSAVLRFAPRGAGSFSDKRDKVKVWLKENSRHIVEHAPAAIAWLVAMIISVIQINSEVLPSGDSSGIETALNNVAWIVILVIVVALALFFVAGPVWLVTRFFFKVYEAIKPQPNNRHP